MRTILTAVDFREATLAFIESRIPYLSPETVRNYKVYAKTLASFFSSMRLQEISADQIRMYQRARMASVGPAIINKECSLLQQMLKRIGRWGDIGHDYQPLPVPKESRGRALTLQEYNRIVEAASSNSEWEPCLCFLLISDHTGGGPKEVRHLRLMDINLAERLVYFPRSAVKNDYRVREVPLNETAFQAITRAMELAVEHGATKLEHYLFPLRPHRGHWDPTRAQTTFRASWAAICRQAGIKELRMYDLRHDACTRMLSDPRVPPESAIAVLGHVSKEMLKRYCHLDREAKRQAVAALERKPVEKAAVRLPNWLIRLG